MPDRSAATNTAFRNAAAYERLMGRWSRRLAPLLLGFGGLAAGDRVLDAGCGTGSLAFEAAGRADIAMVTGVDLTPGFIEFARARSGDPRLRFELADVRDLPFAKKSFDRAFSLLVLHLIPEAARAVAEMLRVVRPGGTVAAAVWDNYGGQPHIRMLWDIAGVLDPSVETPLFRPMNRPDEMPALWREVGLVDVEPTSLMIRAEFADFEDYWSPFAMGEGPHGQYVVGLGEAARAALREHLRRAYCANLPDGPRSFASVAWACRGTVPA